MAAYFFDSSSIVKRYVDETGSNWVRGIANSGTGNRILVARITGVEVVAAVVRRQRAGTISPNDAALVLHDFRSHFGQDYQVVALTPRLLSYAMAVAEIYGLRGYDAVQLAAALLSNARRVARSGRPLILISADAELNAAALAEGLTVDDPNAHP